MVALRMPPELKAAIAAAAADDADHPTRSEKIRRMVTAWLREHGYLKA